MHFKDLKGVLITGGAGYIGSHILKALTQANIKRLVVLDNLSTGFAQAVHDATFIQGDVQDSVLVENILAAEKITAVIHLAAATSIPESIAHPLKYYQNNTFGTLRLLQACIAQKIKHFIFSSTAAVYGQVSANISESSPVAPLNPYGHSKLMSEQIVKDAALKGNFQYAILRYFNVAGADPGGSIGQRTPNATHLIKIAVQTACGMHAALPIYGTDYPTPDGTCIRDFIHVSDLSVAHVNALEYLQNGGPSITLNCGYGHGFSVQEVVDAVTSVSKKSLNVIIAQRRMGDLPKVVADNHNIKTVLNWQPKFDNLNYIIQTALDWEKKLVNNN